MPFLITTSTRPFSRRILACETTPISRCFSEVWNSQLIRTSNMASSQQKPMSRVRFSSAGPDSWPPSKGTESPRLSKDPDSPRLSKGPDSPRLSMAPGSPSLFQVPESRRFLEGSNSRHPSKIPVSTSTSSSYRTSRNWESPIGEVDASSPVELAKAIFFQGVQNVIPSRLIKSNVKLQGSVLKFEDDDNTTIDLKAYKKKYIVGFGKACLSMAESLVVMLYGQVNQCIVSVPHGSRKSNNRSIEVHAGAENNIPDEDSFKASKAIVDVVQSCTEEDLLIVLISGGGSALLPYPIPPITLDEKIDLIKHLSKAGCTINEMNTVRKRLSLVKGGGLVGMCKAKRIISLIISDVAGSPLQVIASGPTVENFDSEDAAINIIEKYGLQKELPESILQILSNPPAQQKRETFEHVTNFIIGDNKIALEASANGAKKFGLEPYIITTRMFGEANEVGYDMANITDALAYCITHEVEHEPIDDPTAKSYLETIKRVFKKNKWTTANIIPEVFDEYESESTGICLLFGGETTVTVRGQGKGGRNQELALAAGIKTDLSRNLPHVRNKVAILSAGTDGIDGPSTAAGAVVEGTTIHNAQLQGLSPVAYLKNNDSFNFFHEAMNGKYHIVCGHTETNVMDLVVIVILKKLIKKEAEKKPKMPNDRKGTCVSNAS